jgi:LuxR family maltose regulon positive regulatory protein
MTEPQGSAKAGQSEDLPYRDAFQQRGWRSKLKSATELANAEDSAEAWESVAEAAWWLQDTEALFPARERALRLYRQAGDLHAAARMAIAIGNDYFDFRGEPAVANGWYRRASRLLEGLAPSAEHAWLCVWEARLALMARHDHAAAIALAGEGLALAARLACQDVEPLALALRGLALVSQGSAGEGMSLLDEASATALGGEVSDALSVGLTCCYLIGACEQVRDYGRAAQWCVRLREFCSRHEFASLLTNCRLQYGSVLSAQGEWQAAEWELLAAKRDMEEWRPALLPGVLARLGELRRRQGRWEEARILFERAGNHPLALLGHASLDHDTGAHSTAFERVRLLLRRLPGGAGLQRIPALELLALLELSAGRANEAEDVLEEMKRAVRSFESPALLAAVQSTEAALAAAAGREAEAAELLEDAADMYARTGMPFESAACRHRLAELLVRRDDRQAAARTVTTAADTFRRLGAKANLARAEGLAAEINGEVRETAEEAELLTPREREVLRLVADGETDREIAQRLGLSRHTVHRHISNIRGKLGVASRSAAVARAQAQRLL